MSEDPNTPAAPAAETPAPAETTAPEQAKAEEPKEPAKQEPDWRAAYVGLQTNLNKSHQRTAEVLKQNEALVGAITTLKQEQREILRATGGDDAVKAAAAREAQALAAEAQRRAATAATQLVSAQADLLVAALTAAGVAPNDPSIDWAQDAPDVETWVARVKPSVQARIQKANEERIASQLKSVQAKTQKEIEAEAEARTQRQLKEAGVDRIDSAKGSGPTTFAERIRDMDPGSPEFQRLVEQAKSGRLRTK